MSLNYIKRRSLISSLCNRNCRKRWITTNQSTDDLQLHRFPSFNLMFVGTGGSTCSKLRGTPSTLLHLGSENFLFDAGEGTMRQSLFGSWNLKRTTRIFITHMHGDHVMGLLSLVLNNHIRNDDDDDHRPLMLYGPQGLHEYLCTIVKLTDTAITQEVIVHELLITEDDVKRTFFNKPIPWYKTLNKFQHQPLDQRKYSKLLKRVEINSDGEGLWSLVDDARIKVKAGLISHRIPCFGFVIKETDQVGALDNDKCVALGMNSLLHGQLYKELKQGKDVLLENNTMIKAKDVIGPAISGRKVVILGDTSDASELASAAKDCDILVHEATYSNDFREVSKLKGHSTPSMAALTALKFNAKRLILNHIGNIYLPNFSDLKSNDTRSSKATDKVLYEEACKELCRPQHVMVSRDFSVAKIPVGGYKMNNDDFYYMNTSLSLQYHSAPKSHLEYLVSPSMTAPVPKLSYNNNKNNNNNNNKYYKTKNINNLPNNNKESTRNLTQIKKNT